MDGVVGEVGSPFCQTLKSNIEREANRELVNQSEEDHSGSPAALILARTTRRSEDGSQTRVFILAPHLLVYFGANIIIVHCSE